MKLVIMWYNIAMYTQRTKIIATIGPASDDADVFGALVDAGLDVARINFSHGTHASNGAALKMIRSVAGAKGANVAILADLQGPRVRTVVETSEHLMSGMIVAIVPIASGDDVHAALTATEVPAIGFDQPTVVAALRTGDRIFIEDGLKQLVVTDVRVDGRVLAEVRVGGEVSHHKGVNLPDTNVPLPALTRKDERDLAFLLAPDVVKNVDFIALSFVRSAQDVEDLRARIAQAVAEPTERPRIVVKIERPEAVAHLEAIIQATDAVMVARGDLATETGQSNVVVLQKRIIALALRAMKPVIVATQMLASMEKSPRPTRAEIADVTNAVIDHADAVMLSGETAGGDFPRESVATMYDIIRAAEVSPYDDVEAPLATDVVTTYLVKARDTWEHARAIGADAIVCVTDDGHLARALAHFRPACRIVALTPSQHVRRQLALVWGVEAYYDKKALSYDAQTLLAQARNCAQCKNCVLVQ